MGYTTEFDGFITIEPPLEEPQLSQWRALCANDPRDDLQPGMPRSYCQWEVSADGSKISWDGGEKFYDSPEWMRYLLIRYVIPTGRTANGVIMAQGEEVGDVWRLIVEQNEVFTQHFDFQRKVEQIELPRKKVGR